MSAARSVVELAQALVRIPSVNPDGDPGTPHTGEKACAEFVGEFLRASGAEVEFREVLPGRPNVLGRFPSDRPGKPKLLFAPHTDTVSVGGMTIDPFCGDVVDGKLLGRGASDTKGPGASMLWALHEERAHLASLPYEIWFAGLMGEEAGLQGSTALAAETDFDFVIVGEPTELKVVNATKGSVWFTLTTRGKSVHASTPERGENAITKMMDALAAVRGDVSRYLATLHHPALGSPTISIDVISGGTKVNIVPDQCIARIDHRSIPGEDLEVLVGMIRAACPDIGIEFTPSLPLFTPPDHPVIRALERVGSSCTGAPWFCDASPFAARGVAAVALGPGKIAQAHTEDEFIAVSDLEAGAAFFRKFLQSLPTP